MWYSPSWKFMKKTFSLVFSFQNLEDLKISMHLLPTKNQTEKAESFDYLFYDGNQDNLATREKRVCSKVEVVRIVTKLLIILLILAGCTISHYYFNNWRDHHIGRTKRNFFLFFFSDFSALIIFFSFFLVLEALIQSVR